MDRARVGPPAPRDEDRDHVVVMRNVSWELYEALLAARPKWRPRMAYLDGVLELMTTSGRHELVKTMLARLVEAYAESRGVSLNGYGHMTLRKKRMKAGVESDECYFIGPIKPFPDLAIEVVETHGSVEKLEIYRRLGVGEVWFWIDGAIWVYRLVEDRYVEAEKSTAVRGIDLHALARIVLTLDEERQTETVAAYRASLLSRRRRAAPRTHGSHRKRAIRRRR